MIQLQDRGNSLMSKVAVRGLNQSRQRLAIDAALDEGGNHGRGQFGVGHAPHGLKFRRTEAGQRLGEVKPAILSKACQ